MQAMRGAIAETITGTRELAQVIPESMAATTFALGMTVAEQRRLLLEQKTRATEAAAQLAAMNQTVHDLHAPEGPGALR